MKWAAWLTMRGFFQSVVLAQPQVGHTHGRQDRCFAKAAKGLSRATVLEDPL